MTRRAADGTSTRDAIDRVGPFRRRTIWSCTASRGILLQRYYLLETRWFAMYLHHLHASDDDRALHDHPWSFVTCLLSSGYFEWIPPTQRPWRRRSARTRYTPARVWRRRFSVLWRPATWQHRLELMRPTWTLVFRFRRKREWGFWTRSGWLDWKTYGRQWCD